LLLLAVTYIGCDRAPDASTSAPPADAADLRQSAATESALAAAQQYLESNDLASAATILAKLLETAPGDHRAHELFGRVLYLQGRPGEAYDHYRAAVEAAGEDDPAAAAGLNQSAGEIASAAGLPKPALDHFRAAGRLDPSAPKHPLYEAQILIQLDRRDEAREALERVLSLDPDEAYAHASLAVVALRDDDQPDALRHIGEARAIAPGNLGIRVQEARIRRHFDQPRRALELLLALNPRLRTEEAVTSEIAACYLALDRPRDAALAWEQRYRADPHSGSAWRAAVRAGEAHLAAGRREDAQWWWQQARLAAPEADEVRALGRKLQAPD
jgi:tetratricopeptide (TPR) repeat protein